MKKENSMNEAELRSDERYLSRLAEFSDFYLYLVIFSGAAAVAAIVIAVLYNVLLGIALAIVTASVYSYFSDTELKKQLGFSYKSKRGRIAITKAVAKYGNTLYIPSRLMWSDVAEISDGAMKSEKNAKMVGLYIPRSIERIGKDIFGDNPPDTVIYYEGSREEWESIEKLTSFDDLKLVFDAESPTLSRKAKKKRNSCADGEADV